ncbi:uncharacterized protein LOC142335316 isoform X2 [Convolutriloba macropyga]|uniref:uncharacterized protein LOC142335316 isoform X2 n=1 Tax=Convolutriloba macropyga TaxID=536237 RepID=UPI003F525375
MRLIRVLTPVEQTDLSKKITSFNSDLSDYFKYQSKLVEDSDSDVASGVDSDVTEDDKRSLATAGSSRSGRARAHRGRNTASSSRSSRRSANANRKSAQVVHGAVIGHVKEKEQRELDNFSAAFTHKTGQNLRVETAIGRGGASTVDNDKGPKLAELYRYEGFIPNATNELPDADMEEILMTTLAAQPHLSFKRAYESEARFFLLSDLSIDIAIDLFWWFFLEKYAQNDETQENLLHRVSENYVKFLWKSPSGPKKVRFRNTFFKNYPDILSQAMYCAFCHTFPASWRQFNDKFINNLTTKVFLWLTGCQAEFNHHKKWNLPDLEPLDLKADFESDQGKKADKTTARMSFADDLLSTDDARSTIPSKAGGMSSNHKRHAAIFATDNGSSTRSSRRGMRTSSVGATSLGSRKVQFNLNEGGERSYAYRPNRSQKRDPSKSTPMNLKDSCDHHVFDVTGKSPLMCSYLGRSVTQSHPVTNRVLIGRTELLPQTSRADPVTIGNSVKDSSSDNLTYAQFVARQFKDTRKVLKDVTEKETQFNKEIADMWKTTTSEIREADERMQMLLTDNAQVKKLSNLLMLEIMTEPSQRTTMASKAIKEALDSIEMSKSTSSVGVLDSQHSISNNSLVLGKSLDVVAEKNVPALPPISQ